MKITTTLTLKYLTKNKKRTLGMNYTPKSRV